MTYLKFRQATSIVSMLVATVFIGTGLATAETDGLRKAKFIAVEFYADWCEPCAAMEQKIALLSEKYDHQPILGDVLDVTNHSSRDNAEMLASRLGLEELWPTGMENMGDIFILDAATGELLEKLTPEESFAAMTAKVDKILAR